LGPHDGANSREFFMRLANLPSKESYENLPINIQVSGIPVVGKVDLSISLTLQRDGSVGYRYRSRVAGLGTFNYEAAIKLWDCWNEEAPPSKTRSPQDGETLSFITISGTVWGLANPGQSVQDGTPQSFTSPWVKEHWFDLAPGGTYGA